MKDIIIRTYGEKQTIWVSEIYLCKKTNIQNEYIRFIRSAYKKSVPVYQRNNDILPEVKGKSWRWGKINGAFYYDYETIPNREPKNYKLKLGTYEEVVSQALNPYTQEQLKERAKQLLQEKVKGYVIHQHETHYMYHSQNKFNRQIAIELSQAVAWAKMLVEIRSSKGWIQFGIETLREFDELVAELMSSLNLKGFKVSNPLSLRRKLDEFAMLKNESKQLHYIMPKTFGNRNAAMVGKLVVADTETGEVMECDVHETLMYYYFMNKANAAIEFKTTLYHKYYLPDMEALGYGDRVISERTFCFHTEKFASKLKTYKERYGADRYNKHLLTYVPMEKLRYACSLWVADGSGLKLAYEGTGGKAVTLYMMRVFDVASTALVGYAISETKDEGEDERYVLASLKMAIDTADGYTALDFLSDNGKGFTKGTMQEKLKMLFPKVRTINVGNSQENDAERLNKLFNNLARQHSNWAGQYQATKKEWKANAYKIVLVSKEQALMQALSMVEQWNSHVGPDGLTRMERFKNNINPKATKLDERLYRYVFGHSSEVDLSYMRGFVQVEHHEQKYLFTIPDYENNIVEINRQLGNIGKLKCMIKWDEKIADIYTLESKYLLSCEAVKKAHKSYAEATEDSYQNLGELRKRKIQQIAMAGGFGAKVEQSMEVLQQQKISEKLDYAIVAKFSDDTKAIVNEQDEQGLQEVLTERKVKPKKDTKQRAFDDIF